MTQIKVDKVLLQKKAQTFLDLHSSGKLLILPNIWNPIGARILQTRGFPAAATASAAISASLGFQDGEKIKRSTLMDILSRIARSVEIPVSADIEAGFAGSLSELEETIQQIIACGVVGINIEDSLVEGQPLRKVDEQCQRIARVREVADKTGVHLVINARVDSFLADSFQSNEERITDTLNRAGEYLKAGADCIYPVGPGDKKTVEILRKEISSPINILASARAISLKEMQKIGVNRVSFGPYIFRSILKKFTDIVDHLKELSSYEIFSENMFSGDDVKEFLHPSAE